jgi:hypothetical protein
VFVSERIERRGRERQSEGKDEARREGREKEGGLRVTRTDKTQ